MINNKKIVTIMSLGIAATFLIMTPDAWSVLKKIEMRQIAANEKLIEWKQAYSALLPVNALWEAAYTSERDATDLLKLSRYADIEKHGLAVNIDLIKQTASSPVTVNGIDIGLQRLCLATTGESLELSAPTITDLRSGLRSLSKRRDISMGSIEITSASTPSVVQAKIKPFCVLVRTAESLPGAPQDNGDGA